MRQEVTVEQLSGSSWSVIQSSNNWSKSDLCPTDTRGQVTSSFEIPEKQASNIRWRISTEFGTVCSPAQEIDSTITMSSTSPSQFPPFPVGCQIPRITNVKTIPRGAASTFTPTSNNVITSKPIKLRAECVSELLAPAAKITSANSTDLFSKYGWRKPTSLEQLSEDTNQMMKSYTSKKLGCNDPSIIKSYFDPTIPQEYAKSLLTSINFIADTFGFTAYTSLGSINKGWSFMPGRFHAVIASDYVFYKDTLKSLGADRQILSEDNWKVFGGQGMAFGNVFVVNILPSSINLGPGLYANLIAHEFFHAVQFNLLTTFDPNGERPTAQVANWLMEGSAVFVGCKVNYLTNGYCTFSSFGNPPLLDNVRKYGTNSIKGLDWLELSGDSNVYWLGYAATEFLVSQIGFEKFLQIFTESSRIIMQSDFANQSDSTSNTSFRLDCWKLAFEEATGVPLLDFYQMFEEIRPVLGIPKT